MQTNTLKLLLAFAVVTLVVTACSSAAKETPKAAAAAAPVGLPVDARVVTATPIDQTETVAGSILPNREVAIMSELPKKVITVGFKDGSFVRQGQVLYRLDDADILAKLRQLQAEINLARINEHRLAALLKTETVRQEEYDIAASKLQSLQAAQELLQVELGKTIIRAPFSGNIGITKVFAGTLVSPGMPLVTLQEQGTIKIQFSISEKYLHLVKTGSKIFFHTALNGVQLAATVVSAEAGVDQQSRNITVQAIASNPDGKFKPGMSAKVFFNTAAAKTNGILVPTEALIPGGKGYSVFVVKNNTAKITPVTITNRNEKEALISSGLTSGDTVMISNMLRAADGAPVTVVSVQ
jgi:membrane fusion protein (multidrug efflux system)